VERADVHRIAQLREREALLRIGIQRGASAIDDLQLARQAAGLATLAVAIARGARGVCVGEESDIFAARLARRARRAAEDPRRFDGVEERAVGLRLAAGDGFPTLGVGGPVGGADGGFAAGIGTDGAVHDGPGKAVSMLTNVGRMPTHYAPVLALSLRFLVDLRPRQALVSPQTATIWHDIGFSLKKLLRRTNPMCILVPVSSMSPPDMDSARST
jgi:hypothetical protein